MGTPASNVNLEQGNADLDPFDSEINYDMNQISAQLGISTSNMVSKTWIIMVMVQLSLFFVRSKHLPLAAATVSTLLQHLADALLSNVLPVRLMPCQPVATDQLSRCV